MGREIRRVPPNWKHPCYADGRFIPLYDSCNVKERQAEWDKDKEAWDRGEFPDYASDDNKKLSFEEWEGPRPDPCDYMPYWSDEERTHYQLYETTTEGTPKGPVFEMLDELYEWAAENATTFANFTATKEEWRKMLGDGIVGHRDGNIFFC